MTDYTITADELAALREWARCPEHGPICRTSDCCCADRHGLGGNPVITAILARYPEVPDVDEQEVRVVADAIGGTPFGNPEVGYTMADVQQQARAAIQALDEHRRRTSTGPIWKLTDSDSVLFASPHGCVLIGQKGFLLLDPAGSTLAELSPSADGFQILSSLHGAIRRELGDQ